MTTGARDGQALVRCLPGNWEELSEGDGSGVLIGGTVPMPTTAQTDLAPATAAENAEPHELHLVVTGAPNIADVVAKTLQQCQNGLVACAVWYRRGNEPNEGLLHAVASFGRRLSARVQRSTESITIRLPFAIVTVELADELVLVYGHRLRFLDNGTDCGGKSLERDEP